MSKKKRKELDASSNIRSLWQSLKKPRGPKEVWQGQFDGLQEALERIAAADLGDEVSEGDLCAYALDLTYQSPGLQKNLLLHALPICLNQWQMNLIDNVESGFTQSFHHALAANLDNIRLDTGDRVMDKCINFMQQSILDKMSTEAEIYQVGRTAPHFWVHHLASLGTFTDIRFILEDWEDLPNSGLAICFIEYLSLFMYDEKDNPVFAPFDCKLGGGPPQPWDYESNGFEERWLDENIALMTDWLSYEHLNHLADRCSILLKKHPQFGKMKTVIDELEDRRDRVELRIFDLIEFLSKPSGVSLNEWSV